MNRIYDRRRRKRSGRASRIFSVGILVVTIFSLLGVIAPVQGQEDECTGGKVWNEETQKCELSGIGMDDLEPTPTEEPAVSPTPVDESKATQESDDSEDDVEATATDESGDELRVAPASLHVVFNGCPQGVIPTDLYPVECVEKLVDATADLTVSGNYIETLTPSPDNWSDSLFLPTTGPTSLRISYLGRYDRIRLNCYRVEAATGKIIQEDTVYPVDPNGNASIGTSYFGENTYCRIYYIYPERTSDIQLRPYFCPNDLDLSGKPYAEITGACTFDTRVYWTYILEGSNGESYEASTDLAIAAFPDLLAGDYTLGPKYVPDWPLLNVYCGGQSTLNGGTALDAQPVEILSAGFVKVPYLDPNTIMTCFFFYGEDLPGAIPTQDANSEVTPEPEDDEDITPEPTATPLDESITVTFGQYLCPRDTDLEGSDFDTLLGQCTVSAKHGTQFTIFSDGEQVGNLFVPDGSQTTTVGNIPTDDLVISQLFGDDYSPPVVYCAIQDEGGKTLSPFQAEPVVGSSSIAGRLPDGTVLLCDWFNTYLGKTSQVGDPGSMLAFAQSPEVTPDVNTGEVVIRIHDCPIGFDPEWIDDMELVKHCVDPVAVPTIDFMAEAAAPFDVMQTVVDGSNIELVGLPEGIAVLSIPPSSSIESRVFCSGEDGFSGEIDVYENAISLDIVAGKSFSCDWYRVPLSLYVETTQE